MIAFSHCHLWGGGGLWGGRGGGPYQFDYLLQKEAKIICYPGLSSIIYSTEHLHLVVEWYIYHLLKWLIQIHLPNTDLGPALLGLCIQLATQRLS